MIFVSGSAVLLQWSCFPNASRGLISLWIYQWILWNHNIDYWTCCFYFAIAFIFVDSLTVWYFDRIFFCHMFFIFCFCFFCLFSLFSYVFVFVYFSLIIFLFLCFFSIFSLFCFVSFCVFFLLISMWLHEDFFLQESPVANSFDTTKIVWSWSPGPCVQGWCLLNIVCWLRTSSFLPVFP